MRIGLVRMRYTPYGGAEVFLRRFLRELLKRGHSIDIFSSEWPEGEGITVHRIETTGPSFLRPLVFARRTEETIERVRPDIVIGLEKTGAIDIYRAGDGCHRAWLDRRSAVSSTIKRLALCLNPLHHVLLHLEKRLLSSHRLRFVVANSRMVKEEIRKHYKLPEKKICVIYNGINLSDFDYPDRDALRREKRRALGIGEDSLVLLFVGSGFERKGLVYLIRALKVLKDRFRGRDIRALVIGRGRTNRYGAEAERLGIGDRVVFTGPVKDAHLYYPAGDIFMLPTLYDPFSNASLEAMAAGLPVVTSRANGASEIITNGKEGAVCDVPYDHEELAEKTALFMDDERRTVAGRLAAERASDFPIERTVGEFLNLLGEEKR